MPTADAQTTFQRPGVAIVAAVQTPYRLHVHRRFARELPEIRLWSLFTHDVPDSPWERVQDDEIGTVMFGSGEDGENRSRPRHALHEWRKGGRITRWLRDHDIRAVVANGYNDPVQLRVIRWCRSRGIPCFLWADSNIQGDTAAGLRRTIKNIVVPAVLGRTTGCFAFGRNGRDYFRRYGVPDDRIHLIPFEPDYELIESVPEDRIAAVRERFGLRPDRRRIVFTGRLVDLKRVDLAVDAFLAIADERPDWDLLIVGDGPLREALAARVPADRAGRVIWAGFIGDQATLAAVYRACDALVLPSQRDAWALVVSEAAAAGLAIVATSVVGATRELVEEGVNGRLVPRDDGAALTAALRDVTDPDRIDGMKESSRRILRRWREQADPVRGFRAALTSAGVLPPVATGSRAPGAHRSAAALAAAAGETHE